MEGLKRAKAEGRRNEWRGEEVGGRLEGVERKRRKCSNSAAACQTRVKRKG